MSKKTHFFKLSFWFLALLTVAGVLGQTPLYAANQPAATSSKAPTYKIVTYLPLWLPWQADLASHLSRR